MLIPKKNYIRDKKFLRWLAEQPCMKCKYVGATQAAHLEKGGRGIKGGDDKARPLCCVRKGELGCHEKLDQHLEIRYWEENLNRALLMPVYETWKKDPQEAALMLMRF